MMFFFFILVKQLLASILNIQQVETIIKWVKKATLINATVYSSSSCRRNGRIIWEKDQCGIIVLFANNLRSSIRLSLDLVAVVEMIGHIFCKTNKSILRLISQIVSNGFNANCIFVLIRIPFCTRCSNSLNTNASIFNDNVLVHKLLVDSMNIMCSLDTISI